MQLSKTLAVFLLLIIASKIYSQKTVGGVAVDGFKHPIVMTTVSLMAKGNIIKKIQTDSLGKFLFKNVFEEKLTLHFSHMSFNEQTIYLKSASDTFIVVELVKNIKDLDSVEVRSKKPVFERAADRFVFNVSNSPLVTGNTIWDVLKQTPLVAVDEQGGISIIGKQGASVYINDRKPFLKGEDLYKYLKALPSDNILRIEIITMPSSRYDAGNSGGIINVVLKKNELEGFNGSLVISDRLATFNAPGISGLLNYKRRKISQIISASAQSRNTFLYLNNEIIYGNGEKETVYSETVKKPSTSYLLSSSTEFQINASSFLGLNIDLQMVKNNDEKSGFNTVTKLNNFEQKTLNQNPVTEKSKLVSSNFFYKYSSQKFKRTIEFNADLVHYYNEKSAIFLSSDQFTPASISYGNNTFTEQDISNYSLKIDYSQLILKDITLEAGAKYSNTKTDNPFVFYDFVNGNWKYNYIRSNHFTHQEKISAAYVTLQKKISKSVSLQVGARVENTELTNTQVTSKQNFSQQYLKIFPSLFVSYKIDPQNALSFSIKSDIYRPTYSQFNPFIYYISNKYLVSGNPFLRPNSVINTELSYILKQRFVFVCQYSRSYSLFGQINVLIPPDTISLERLNYGSSSTFSFSSVVTQPVIKNKWSVNITNSLIYREQDLTTPQTTGATSNWNYSLRLNQTFTNLFKSKVNAFFSSVYYTDNLIGNDRITSFGEVNIDFSRDFTNGFKASLSATDIFNTQKLKHFYNINSLFKTDFTGFSDTRAIRISITKSFGNTKMKSLQKRRNGNTEESNRIR